MVVSGHLDRAALVARLRSSHDLFAVGNFQQFDGVGFRAGGFLPRAEWQPVRCAHSCDPDQASRVGYPGSFIALLGFSREMTSWLRSLEGTESLDADLTEAVLHALECQLPEWITPRNSELLGFYRNEPGLSSVTFDPNLGLRIGLHLDSWEGASVAGRRHKRSRLLINLGASPRQLLFMTTPVDVLQELLGIGEGPGYFVDKCFAATSGRNRTVYAIEIQPDEGYIAPTECLVHDGSTAMGSSVDICFTMVSRFILGPVDTAIDAQN
jgi:hypothetical protein